MIPLEPPPLKLAAAPIIEAVIEVECDMPPGFEPISVKGHATKVYSCEYSKTGQVYRDDFRFTAAPDTLVQHKSTRCVHAIQFKTADEKQLVQVLAQGFAFNRLAPYTSLDDYLPEFEKRWKQFVEFASPVQVRTIKLRYINCIPLPLDKGRLVFKDFLAIAPELPAGSNLTFTGFLNQYSAIEEETGHQATVILTTQDTANGVLPFIFDIGVNHAQPLEVGDWNSIIEKIYSLRSLKNRIFGNGLTEKCLDLFKK